MDLTPAQQATFVTNCNGQASLAAARTAHDAPAVASFYNQLSSGPAVSIWRKDVQASEVVASIVMSEFVALTAIKQNGLILLLTPATVDATSVNVQNSFSFIFAAGATLTALAAVAKRTATRAEALFSAGAPTPVSAVYGQTMTPTDVNIAMGW